MTDVIFMLVLLLGSNDQSNDIRASQTMTALPHSFGLEENCKRTGESWVADAAQAKERKPRYYCVPVVLGPSK